MDGFRLVLRALSETQPWKNYEEVCKVVEGQELSQVNESDGCSLLHTQTCTSTSWLRFQSRLGFFVIVKDKLVGIAVGVYIGDD